MSAAYTWSSILGIVREHKKDLISAHIVAILAAVASVPIPLLMPLLVDEVLLHQPGRLVAWLDSHFPAAWHGPVLYIGAVLAVTLALRLTALILGVWQGRSFTLIAKDVVFRMREQMLLRLSRIAMSEYETLGSGAVASHFVKDLDAVDNFIGASVSKFLVALLSIIGTAIVLLWMHWQLALFILLLNPAVIYFTTVLGKRGKSVV